MVWSIATLGIFYDIDNIEEKLNGFQYSRLEKILEKEKSLISAIQLSPRRYELSDDVHILSGMVIDEYIVRNSHIIKKDENGKWIIKKDKPFVDTRWTEFWITTKSIILVERKNARGFAFRVISKALTMSEEYIHPVIMDIERIANDHPGHWLGSITDRRGNMQNATMFGTNLEGDTVIGDEYIRCHKAQVGFITDFFEAPVKIKVTRDGTIVIMKNLTNDIGAFIQYIRQNLLQYATPI